MAMAAAFVGTPSFARATLSASFHPTLEAFSGSRSALEHRNRGAHRGGSSNFSASGGPSEPAAASGLSSSGRDGGACCGSTFRSSGSASRNAAGLEWRAFSGGLLRLDVRESSASRRRNGTVLPRRRLPLRISAEKPDLTNVASTVFRAGKQGLEAGTKLVPESVPRPVAQAGVGFAGVLVASFLLKSLFSTVTFIVAIGAVSYFGFLFLTKGESSSSSGKDGDGSSGKPKDSDEALEEARRIMEKYK